MSEGGGKYANLNCSVKTSTGNSWHYTSAHVKNIFNF